LKELLDVRNDVVDRVSDSVNAAFDHLERLIQETHCPALSLQISLSTVARGV
jgi:hypothetical protein